MSLYHFTLYCVSVLCVSVLEIKRIVIKKAKRGVGSGGGKCVGKRKKYFIYFRSDLDSRGRTTAS